MRYDLVFEGGGAKGMVFVGAMQAFEARGHEVGRLLGTSAGAITAAFLAAGYDSGEMMAALNEKGGSGKSVFADFMGSPTTFSEKEIAGSQFRAYLEKVDIPGLPASLEKRVDQFILKALLKNQSYRHIFSFVERGGWYVADAFVTWMKRKMNEGTFQGQPRNFSEMTLSEFFDATGSEVSFIAADTEAQRMLILKHQTAPDLPLVWAVRMSMSIPMLWQEVIWEEKWGSYRGREMAGHSIVDGGLLSNFPIELFLSKRPDIVSLMGQKPGRGVLGLLIDEALGVDGTIARMSYDRPGLLGLNTVKRVLKMIDTMTQAHDRQVMEAFQEVVIRLPARGYGTTEFDMTDDRREKLVAAGRKSMDEYLTSHASMTLSGPGTLSPAATNLADARAQKILSDEE